MKTLPFFILLLATLAFATCEKVEVLNKTIVLNVSATGTAQFDAVVYAEAGLLGSCNVSVTAFTPQIDGATYSVEYKPELIQPRTYRYLPVKVKLSTQNAASRYAEGALFANDTTSSKSSSAKIKVSVDAPVWTPTPKPSASAAPTVVSTPTDMPFATATDNESFLSKYGLYIFLLVLASIVIIFVIYFFFGALQK